MIEVLASMVKKEIAENVKSCCCFSIRADEAKDVSMTEQLAIIIRFFDEHTMYSRVFYTIPPDDAAGCCVYY